MPHPHSRDIPFTKRVAILTLHWYGGKSWAEISSLLGVYAETAKCICVRAKERASNPQDFDDVLLHIAENVDKAPERRSLRRSTRKSRGSSWTGEIVIGMRLGEEEEGEGEGEEEEEQLDIMEGVTAMRDMDWR